MENVHISCRHLVAWEKEKRKGPGLSDGLSHLMEREIAHVFHGSFAIFQPQVAQGKRNRLRGQAVVR